MTNEKFFEMFIEAARNAYIEVMGKKVGLDLLLRNSTMPLCLWQKIWQRLWVLCNEIQKGRTSVPPSGGLLAPCLVRR